MGVYLRHPKFLYAPQRVSNSHRAFVQIRLDSFQLLRFFFSSEGWLQDRHDFIAYLGLHAESRGDYMSYLLAVDPDTDTVPELLKTYSYEPAQVTLFLNRKIAKLDMVNSDAGGFLKLKELTGGSKFDSVPRL